MRAAFLALTLLLGGCATRGLDDRSLGWFCTAQANEGAARATSHRSLTFDGRLREGWTEFDLTLAGDQPARLLAEWRESGSLPELAEGRYRFRMSRHVVPSEPGRLQLVGGNAVLGTSDWSPGLTEVSVSGRTLASVLGSGGALGLRLVARDGRPLGSVAVDRSAFDLALGLARQADASALAKAADFSRLCQREERIVVT